MRFVHFADYPTAFASDSDISNVHATLNRELVGVEIGTRPTDFLSTSVELHI